MRSKNVRTCSSIFLNQEINPATTSNLESKSKSRLNIKDIKPRIKEQTQQRHFPLFEIQTQQISKLVIQILHKHLPRLTIPSANKNHNSKALNLFTKTIPRDRRFTMGFRSTKLEALAMEAERASKIEIREKKRMG